MSDDDCDIFSAARKRAPKKALPKELSNSFNDSISSEVDYDFLADTTITTKGKKAGRERKTKPPKEPLAQETNEVGKDVFVPPEPVQTEASPRCLSPVSQLLLEMEKTQDSAPKKRGKKKVGIEENVETPCVVGPVARRTRSSLGKTIPEPVIEQSIDNITASAPNKPQKKSVAGQ